MTNSSPELLHPIFTITDVHGSLEEKPQTKVDDISDFKNIFVTDKMQRNFSRLQSEISQRLFWYPVHCIHGMDQYLFNKILKFQAILSH